jgi:DTW domain-containing protein YfiP|eukprot:scaffold1024_cov233-Chaetoceros_neogracile.AAC.5
MPLCLEKCTIKVGYNFTPDQLDLVRDCLEKGQKPLLLFPGKNAISLDRTDVNVDGRTCEENEEDIDVQELRNGQQLLILIDGTWAEARRMIMQSLTLVEQCQQVQFTAENESIYDVVRKEPEKHCISTLEACSYALTLLEPDETWAREAKEYLEGSMRYMVEKKLNVHEIRNPEPRFTKPGVKIYEKNKRRFEIKEELFKKN